MELEEKLKELREKYLKTADPAIRAVIERQAKALKLGSKDVQGF